jgi:hypothetical protein
LVVKNGSKMPAHVLGHAYAGVDREDDVVVIPRAGADGQRSTLGIADGVQDQAGEDVELGGRPMTSGRSRSARGGEAGADLFLVIAGA